MHSWAIRRARADIADAARLHALEAATLGDSDLCVGEMREALARAEQRVYFAEAETGLVGFLAAFETVSPLGRRLELDMLGVAEAWRGRGVATDLVRRAIEEAKACGVGSFRAVVAEDNVASRKAFERCGLVAGGALCEMMVYVVQGATPQPYLPRGWSEAPAGTTSLDEGWPASLLGYRGLPHHTLLLIADAAGQPAAGAALLTVHTIAYSGLWIEAHWARDAVATGALARAAVERAKATDMDEVGLLLADPLEGPELWAWAREGLARNGRYRVLGL